MNSLTQDLKDAICEAINLRSGSLGAGTSSLRVDVRFYEDGSVRKVSLEPLFEFNVRSRKPPLDNYNFNGHEEKGLTSTS